MILSDYWILQKHKLFLTVADRDYLSIRIIRVERDLFACHA